MQDKKLRLFIAIDFPSSVKKQIGSVIELLMKKTSGVRWEKPEKIHLTLAFLGYVAEKKVVEIEETMKNCVRGIKPFPLSFTKLGFFLHSGRLILWLGIKQTTGLLLLKKKLDQELKKCGFKQEKRSFSPHVTLGRKKNASKRNMWPVIVERWNKKQGFYFDQVRVNEIVLMQSKLTFCGSIYQIIHRFPFSG